MKRNLLFALLLSVAISYLSATLAFAQNTLQQQKDSLYKEISLSEGKEKLRAYNRLASLYLQEINNEHIIDTIFAIYDEMNVEAQKQENISYQGISRVNKLNALNNKKLYDEIIIQLPATLDFLFQNELWDQYYQAFVMLPEAYRRKGEYERSLAEAQKIYEQAKELQHTEGMGMALFAMSKIYNYQRRFEEQEKCLRECIDLLQDNTLYLNYLASVYTSLISNLTAQKRYDDAIQVAAECEEVNHRYEEASKFRQPTAWIHLWMGYINIYRQSGEYGKAEVYLNKIDSISNGSLKLYEEWAHVYHGKKQYAKALETIDKAIETATNKLQPKGVKMMIFIEMGEAQSAYDLFGEIIKELDAKHNMKYNAQLDELRTQYEVDKHIAEKERNRNYLILALAACSLLIILLGTAFYYNHIITKKNYSLYRQIKGQNRLADELSQLTDRYETLLQAVPQACQEEISCEAAALLPGDKQQRDLVARLREYLLRDANLTKTNISRDELISALGTNKNNLSEAVKVVTGKTLMEYIRNLKLEETRRMLDSHPELTVEAIAFGCGFNAANTFYRLFRKHYGISPAEYRKISNSIEHQQ